eukprot:890080-Pleurochrysis_carterae.AAC.1
MVPRHRTPAIREGDVVAIAVRHFGEEYAIRRACHRNWGLDTIRDEGTVTERIETGEYVIEFADGERARGWKRSLIQFVCRPEQQRNAVQHESSGDKAAVEVEGAEDDAQQTSQTPAGGKGRGGAHGGRGQQVRQQKPPDDEELDED